MRYSAVILPMVLLAACNSEPEVKLENASAEEVAEQVRATGGESFVSPGQWASTVSIESVDLPGAPAEMEEQLKRAFSERQPQKFESCLTPEQAKKPKEEFFAGKGNQCRYDHFTMSGGKIDAKMNCSQGGSSHVMEMAGNYSPDSYTMRMKMTGQSREGPAMTMAMRVDAKRTGECTAGQT